MLWNKGSVIIPDNRYNHQRWRQQLHERVMHQTRNVLSEWFGPHILFSILHSPGKNSDPVMAAMPQEVIWINR